MWRWLIILLLGPAIAALQNGLISGLSHPFNQLNLTLGVFLFLLFTADKLTAVLALTFWTVWFLELSSAAPFGFYFFSYFLTVPAAVWLFRHVFTNRSLWALLALGTLSTAILRLSWWFFNLLASVKFTVPAIASRDYWSTLLLEIILNNLLLALGLILAQRFTRKMRGLFLTKN